jgi:hypothetical protein
MRGSPAASAAPEAAAHAVQLPIPGGAIPGLAYVILACNCRPDSRGRLRNCDRADFELISQGRRKGAAV